LIGALRPLRVPCDCAGRRLTAGGCLRVVSPCSLHAAAPLMSAAFGESRSPRGGVAVARMLLSCGADVGACCKAGSTSLHIVASYGTVALGQLLLDRGADIDRRDSLDETPLHKAALRGDMPMVRFLAETGADLTLRAKCGSTPADFAAGESDASSEHAAIAEYLARAPAP
jgi:ankyrin repeat protein